MNEFEKTIKTCVRYGDFGLTSGLQSGYYVDVIQLMTDIVFLKDVTKRVISLMDKNVDQIGGMELGGVPLTISVALKLDFPYIIVRSRTNAGKSKIIGSIVPNDNILLFEDVVTTGGSIIQAIETIREMEGEVDTVICVVDRGEGVKEKLAEINVKLISLTTAKELNI